MTSTTDLPALVRPDDQPAPPVRILHLGLGNFFRAHQAWYTARASDADQWGISAFSGRSRALAETIAGQGGLYTLAVRASDGDHTEVIKNLSETHAGDDHESWLAGWQLPDLAVVTLTVTEAGYCRGADGGLDVDHEGIAADLKALGQDRTAAVGTAPARLLAGLVARAEAGLPPVTILSCDNLPDNGAVVRTVVRDLAERLDPSLLPLVEATSFPITMVDRITPATTEDDLASVAEQTGLADQAPVITEPFTEWVISGDFVSGRPDWESAGATIVDDVGPFERRKLWLLNGAHSYLAYAGLNGGHETVSEAVGDADLVAGMNAWWDEAVQHLDLPVAELDAYRASLTDRFANPRIRHLLAQIAADGSQKLPIRAVPVLILERETGRSGEGAAQVIAAWLRYLRSNHPSIKDPRRDEVIVAAKGDLTEAAGRIVSLLDETLGHDQDVVALVARLAA